MQLLRRCPLSPLLRLWDLPLQVVRDPILVQRQHLSSYSVQYQYGFASGQSTYRGGIHLCRGIARRRDGDTMCFILHTITAPFVGDIMAVKATRACGKAVSRVEAQRDSGVHRNSGHWPLSGLIGWGGRRRIAVRSWSLSLGQYGGGDGGGGVFVRVGEAGEY